MGACYKSGLFFALAEIADPPHDYADERYQHGNY